jgi:hypothetical protein
MPKKREKLPPGAAYTCVAQGERIVGLAVDPDMVEEERMSAVESDSDSDNVRSAQVRNIVKRLSANFSKRKRVTEEEDEDSSADSISSSSSEDEEDIWEESGNREEEMNGGEEEMNGGEEEMHSREEEINGGEEEINGREEEMHSREEEMHSREEEMHSREEEINGGEEEINGREEEMHSREEEINGREEEMHSREKEMGNPSEVYPTGSYVVALYQGEWYVGQLLDKGKEKNALAAEDYVYLSFMQRVVKDRDLFKWPDKADKLNTLREDILFVCGAPIPSHATSSSRSITYSLSKTETKKANILLNKAYYYHTNLYFLGFLCYELVFGFGLLLYWYQHLLYRYLCTVPYHMVL